MLHTYKMCHSAVGLKLQCAFDFPGPPTKAPRPGPQDCD